MPPCTPPELFVVCRILPARVSNASLCCEPRIWSPQIQSRSQNLCGRNAQHRFRQVCFELVEHGLAKSGWDAARHTLDSRRRRSRLHPESARPARSSFSQRQHPGSGQHFSQRRSSSRWNGQSSQSLRGFESRKPRVRSPLQGGQCFFCNRPAATRPIVSRADARPPPCQFRIPYLAS
jgi:hypothetical protein